MPHFVVDQGDQLTCTPHALARVTADVIRNKYLDFDVRDDTILAQMKSAYPAVWTQGVTIKKLVDTWNRKRAQFKVECVSKRLVATIKLETISLDFKQACEYVERFSSIASVVVTLYKPDHSVAAWQVDLEDGKRKLRCYDNYARAPTLFVIERNYKEGYAIVPQVVACLGKNGYKRNADKLGISKTFEAKLAPFRSIGRKRTQADRCGVVDVESGAKRRRMEPGMQPVAKPLVPRNGPAKNYHMTSKGSFQVCKKMNGEAVSFAHVMSQKNAAKLGREVERLSMLGRDAEGVRRGLQTLAKKLGVKLSVPRDGPAKR